MRTSSVSRSFFQSIQTNNTPKDPDDFGSPWVYTGKDWPAGLVLHFLKDLKKQGLVDYNDSKIVFADTDEGRLRMRDNLWFKEKGVPHQRVTVQTWSRINPQELFDKIKEAEPRNVKLRAALVGVTVEYVRSLPQAKDARNVLGTWLMHATEKNQVGMLNALLKAGVDKEFKDSEGRTALMYAAANGQVGTLQALLKAGAKKSTTDNQGRTALMHAAANGQVGTLKALLKAGAKKSTKDNEGKTAKMHAAEQATRHGDRNAPALRVLKEAGSTSVLKSLYRKQKRDAAKEAGITAMLSAERVDLDELKALIEKGANIHAKNRKGYSAVMLAARHGHADALQVLIENGADFEATHKGLTPLMLATEHGHVDALRVLIENGADIEAMYKPPSFLHLSGKKVVNNALMIAIEKAHVDCMRVLLESGANTEARNKKGITPMMFVAIAKNPHIRSRTKDMLMVLIENGAHIDSQENIGGWTPLMYAVIHANVDAVQLLLENSADINVRIRTGNTVQEIAGMLDGPEMAAIRQLFRKYK